MGTKNIIQKILKEETDNNNLSRYEYIREKYNVPTRIFKLIETVSDKLIGSMTIKKESGNVYVINIGDFKYSYGMYVNFIDENGNVIDSETSFEKFYTTYMNYILKESMSILKEDLGIDTDFRTFTKLSVSLLELIKEKIKNKYFNY
jgi:hypothetical protein